MVAVAVCGVGSISYRVPNHAVSSPENMGQRVFIRQCAAKDRVSTWWSVPVFKRMNQGLVVLMCRRAWLYSGSV